MAVADIFGCMIATTVDLESDLTGCWMSYFSLLPLHDLNPIDPGGDMRRVAFDTGSTLVPLTMPPE